METKKKRLIGILLGLALALAIMPVIGSGDTAYAADDYPVWVDGTQVTSANMDNVLSNDPVNDGKVSFTPATSGDSSTSATLTLKGATITKGHEVEKSGIPKFTCGIYYNGDGPLNVVLESGSDNTLTGGDAFIHGLYSEKGLTISGEGNLTISVKDTGVYAVGDIKIDGGTINASANGDTANCYGIYSQHVVTIKEESKPDANPDSNPDSNLDPEPDPAPSTPISIKNAKVVLSASAFTLNGKVRKPAIKKIGGKVLKSGTDYTVKWSNKSSKNVGAYKVTITGTGKYTGVTKATYKINPKGTSLKTPKRAKKAITVKWKKQSAKMAATRITGYQIKLATNKKFTKNKRTVTVKGYKKVSKKVKKLKSGKKYYVKIRTFKTVKGKKYYSKWSKVKTVNRKILQQELHSGLSTALVG